MGGGGAWLLLKWRKQREAQEPEVAPLCEHCDNMGTWCIHLKPKAEKAVDEAWERNRKDD